MIEFNGEYGCMGDLGMHACHVPFRAGWLPRNVRAILSNIVPERPDGKGGMVPCETWDNATLFCEAVDPATRRAVPADDQDAAHRPGREEHLVLRGPGHAGRARWSAKNPRRLELLGVHRRRAGLAADRHGLGDGLQDITGGIFEFGFSDAILQMWAAFLYELTEGKPKSRSPAASRPRRRPLATASSPPRLRSHANGTTEPV